MLRYNINQAHKKVKRTFLIIDSRFNGVKALVKKLLDAHAQDQKEMIKELLNTNPAVYTAENVEQAIDLYNKTYVKQREESTTASETLSGDTDSEDSDL